MAFFWGATWFGSIFKASPAVHYIFFGDFAPAQSPKKDAVSIGATNVLSEFSRIPKFK